MGAGARPVALHALALSAAGEGWDVRLPVPVVDVTGALVGVLPPPTLVSLERRVRDGGGAVGLGLDLLEVAWAVVASALPSGRRGHV